MLCNTKTIQGYKLNCRDGEIGKAQQFYFDDKHWTIRYLVANTGTWLTGRQVLISPYALVSVNEAQENIEVNLTKKQIEKSPSLNTDKPVSRQFEEDYFGYYEWPVYWNGPYQWGFLPHLSRNKNEWNPSTSIEKAWDPHLRSTHEVNGYHIQASDGEIGHVEDFIIDDHSWSIRYLVINTHNWLPGKKVLVSPQWIDRVSWSESKVFANLTREMIQNSPEYSAETLPSRDYEIRLHDFYNRQGYWMDELVTTE